MRFAYRLLRHPRSRNVLDSIGPFRVHRLLGEGGTGNVYLCSGVDDRECACIKMPRVNAAREKEDLRREIAALARLNRASHPGVVRLLRTGTAGGLPWYAMEFIHGMSLSEFADSCRGGECYSRKTRTADAGEISSATASVSETEPAEVPRLKEAPPPERLQRMLRVAGDLADVLDFIHSEGVVHGDLSPGNVIVRATDAQPVLVDFGESFSAHETGLSREQVQANRKVRGTAAYMAPERIDGALFDARCDVYAFGCILYEIFTGQPPFRGSTLNDVLLQHRRVTPRPPLFHAPWLPIELDGLIQRLLLKRPADRVDRARDIAEALWRLSGEKRDTTRSSRSYALYRPRLAGRDDSLGTLLAALERGLGGLALLSGDSGIGKTRLLNEFGALATKQGFTVISSRAVSAGVDEHGRQLTLRDFEPFSPLLERIADECRANPALQYELSDELGALLQHLAPAPEPNPAAPTVTRESTAAARARLVAALKNALLGYSRDRRILVSLDDLQWFDDLSLQFLVENARTLAVHGVLVVATIRTEQDEAKLRRLEEVAFAKVALGSLSAESIRAMARDMLGVAALPEGLAEFLFERSEGNPFFAAEYLRAALAHDGLRRADSGRWQFQAATEFSLPTSLEELLVLRTKNLSAKAVRALQLAAILGREFRVEVLGALSSARDSIDDEAIEELAARQTVEWVAPGRYRFSHDRLREAAESSLDPSARERLHRIAAQRLEELNTTDPAFASSAEIGIHWSLANEPSRALPCLRIAAEQARLAYAPARAAELYGIAVQQSARIGPSAGASARERAELLECFADAVAIQAQYSKAREAFERALGHLSADPDDRLSRARVHRKIGATHWTVHEYDRAREHLEVAREILGRPSAEQVEQFSEYIEIEIGRLEHLYFSRKVGSETQDLIANLEPIVHRYGSPAQCCHYYVGAACELAARGRYAWNADAVSFARKALRHGTESLSAFQIALARLTIAFLMLPGDQSSCAEALSVLEHAERDAAASADSTLLARVLTYQMVARVRLRDRPGAIAAARRTLAAAEQVQLTPYMAASLACEGWACWADGDLRVAEPLLTRALSLWREHPHAFPFMWLALFPVIDLQLGSGRLSDARASLEALLSPTQQALPEALRAELERALSFDESNAPELFREATAAALRQAHDLRFC
jgi:eukaryotic-like serine/threonine-protein kinase